MESKKTSLFAPIVFFDCFDYPLTGTEVWKYQWRGSGTDVDADEHGGASVVGLQEVMRILDELVEQKVLASGNGFYYLPGRECLVKTRNQRHVVAYRKWRRVLCVIRILRYFPFLRMIAVTNTLAYDNAADESDIDLFIVTKPGYIWTARFWVLLFLKVFHLRPRPGRQRDKICCAFFVDDDHVNVQDVSLPAVIASDPAMAGERMVEDIYLCYWIATLWPVYNYRQTYENVFNQNVWVQKYLPNIAPITPNNMRRVRSVRGMQRFFEWVTRIIPERVYHRLQEMQFPESIRQLRGHDTRVVISDVMLKFHVVDRREEYRNQFIIKMKHYASND